MYRTIILILVLLLILISCKKTNEENNDEISEAIKHASEWIKSFDLDGDGLTDEISFEYTGGGHCCYKIFITLTSDKIEREYPFLMDGGYSFGIPDDSQPDHFNIKDYDNDGFPEIFMEINTYNGIPNKSYPSEWTKKYGVKTNYILFDYQKGNIIVKDFIVQDK